MRVRGGVTGRYIADGLALYVSTQDNDLFVVEVLADGVAPHPTLPVPGDDELQGAAAGLRYSGARR